MTVVLASRCRDGIVLASDTQITESDRNLSYPAQKLHPLGDRGAWGGSGSRAVLTEVAARFSASAAAILDAEHVSHALQAEVLPVQRHHYENYIEHVPGAEGSSSPAAYVMAAGYQGDEPWIVVINPHGMVGHYEDIGFHAIGGGAPMAHQAGTLLAHFRMTERPVAYGVVTAVRVLSALAETAPNVGGRFNVVRITTDGAHHLDQAEIDDVRRDVARWELLEQEALDRLFS